MGYQVLARKWRPKAFREMVGQEHVLKALINSLDHGRLHHAYLFTGTRGVGKTTVARIFAKSLNCETGVSSEPCGHCSACQEINEGRFIDLIEVDAASRTKVEDTRELLENVQYAPTRGRFKVYLIDEVHMLSGHSFNALLKTLEEPPEHVKFLLATTDPQQLPITILSRCLQFSLKAMTPDKIVGHLKFVLQNEMVEFEEPALWMLGREADGSMRDAMSLTDQAISFGNGKVVESDVRAMLGSIDRDHVYGIIEALAGQDGNQLLTQVAAVAEQSPDYNGILASLISTLHRIAVAQLAPDAVDDSDGDREKILRYSQQFAPEQVQLMYQTALLGRKDLPLAPQARSGFEMTLLRMLLFNPHTLIRAPAAGTNLGKVHSPAKTGHPTSSNHGSKDPVAEGALSGLKSALSKDSARSADNRIDKVNTVASKPATIAKPASPAVAPPPARDEIPQAMESHQSLQPRSAERPKVTLDDEWSDLVNDLAVAGPVGNFARNCVLEDKQGDQWLLHLNPRYEALFKDDYPTQLTDAISEKLGQKVVITVKVSGSERQTPDQLMASYKQQQKKHAIELLQSDTFVQALQVKFGATLDVNSVQPLTETDSD